MPARLITLLFALTLAACASAPAERPAEADKPLVILVSIDGFHPSYLERGLTPTLSRLAAEGASGSMRPSFPTKTFPNHYTLVTGLTPDHHGIVNNTMEDPEIPSVTFKLSNKQAVGDRRWWDDAEPIWVTAENAGLTTAAMFWPGSEAAVRGVRPSHWLPYDEDMTGDQRVDQLLAWIDEVERPDLATLYFDIVDTAGHEHGPASDEVNAAIASVDASLSRLVAGLEAKGLGDATTLVIVSDHGMAATSLDRVIQMPPSAANGAARVVFGGAITGIEPAAGREAEVEAEFLAPHDHWECWRKGELPERLAFGTHRRTPSIFCLAETGWEVLAPGWEPRAGGDHGFDNQAPEMRALFILNGPRVEAGARLPLFDNVDVQPLLAELLGIEVPKGDGDADVFAGVLD